MAKENCIICNNCLEEGHSESQCPNPTWCVECKDRGHNVAKCPQARCFNCQQRGHLYPQCPNPSWCPRCKKGGHTLRNCHKAYCTNCEREGHSKSRCPRPSKCVLCGSNDHYTLVCPTHPPWCRNCRQVGHTVSKCPQPLRVKCSRCKQEGHHPLECTNSIVCNNCRVEGHTIRQCPIPVRCLRCDSKVHITKDCPTFPPWCSNCKQNGHRRSACPHPEKCRKCGAQGHTTEDCTLPNRCSNCRQTGHFATTCPLPLSCSRCGLKSHRSWNCHEKLERKGQVPQAASVPAPRHRVLHQSPGPAPAPVPAPRRARDVVAPLQDQGQDRKDEEMLKMSQDNEQQNVSFDDFEINPRVLNNVKKSGYSMPELFLRKIFPIIQDNQIDVMTRSNTEFGHTAAFSISIISKFMERNIGDHPHPEEGSRAVKPHCVVITPTRESAAQISTLAKTFTEATKIRVVVTSGETSVQQQMEDARRGCNILISTPGRLLY